ncbi:MAG: RNA polymerase factor sigma-54 [Phycisphaerae bacterium]
MSQMLSQSLGMHMKMEQRLTPQLIQSMAILQKPVADLEAYIADALEANPALELAEPDNTGDAGPDAPTQDGANGVVAGDTQAEERGFGRLDRFARDNGLDLDDRPYVPVRRAAATGERDAKMDAMANTASRGVGLHEFLLDQWALVDVDDAVRGAGVAIIEHLDTDGYLRVGLEEIGAKARPPIVADVLERALTEVRRLEPAGIAARDTVECLLLQLDALPGDNRIERALIEHHLGDIARNRLPAVAKATGYSVGEINEAIKAMRSSLCLHPGYLVGDRGVPTIRPDVIVEYAETGGDLEVRLAWGNTPKLKVSESVLAMAKSKEDGKETRDFARKHVEAANALIDAVVFRRTRLLEVAHAIVTHQREFFEIGPQGLTVLRMSDLAQELGCDPSTISRTVADKYMQCPRGIYALRSFFTGGTETGNGTAASWGSVKYRVRDVIAAEDPKDPLNDDQVAAKLNAEGVKISRRTVAKYRQQLDIPSARHRRVF